MAIDRITVQGYKALKDPQSIEIRKLTINAGVNSSGKSSMMQPLLLLKQTIEAPYDPGPLLLDGPNVSVTEIPQILSKGQSESSRVSSFSIGIASGPNSVRVKFGKSSKNDLKVQEFELRSDSDSEPSYTLRESLTHKQIEALLSGKRIKRIENVLKHFREIDEKNSSLRLEVSRERWALAITAQIGTGNRRFKMGNIADFMYEDFSTQKIEQDLSRIIHLPALRGNPERTYRTAAVEGTYPGQFHDYAAGIISAWKNREVTEKLDRLRKGLEKLGLSWKVEARRIDDTRVELVVGRLPRARQGGAHDLVSIADVGFGVSQTLPVIVALIAASPGQMVYLEQPEIHLHPRAQYEFGDLIVESVLRGVRVIVETHSDLLIRAIQTKIAQGVLAPADVCLNWFGRDPITGFTKVDTAMLEPDGSFGDWPEDFDQVYLQAESNYLDAVAAKFGRRHE
ncbi:AAA ATPase domain-containing protein [Glycomyces sambucus]|uniref:AAA ATPase domain-containing protein n=1 Tax=Glycomyces sambucus TaxID=380244 RepID=A0A1G9KRJ7_9ACTN|nr:AAA family ATPase [Glycomyces sambucus]SDL52331.1 AAA ATPase domain-containing protein [Glycomyces sambucus]